MGKKRIFFSFFILLLSIFIVCTHLEAEGKKFEIKITGGISSLLLGDVNSYLKDASQYQIDNLKPAGYIAEREFENFHAGKDLEITALVSISERLFFTISTGYVVAKEEKNTLVLNSSFSTLTSTLNHKVKAVPITLGINYTFPLSSNSRVYLFTGGGFYFSKFSEAGEKLLDLKSGEKGYTKSFSADTKATGFGCYSGLGFEFGISKTISFLIETNARFAKISGFSGTSRSKFNASEYEEAFDLYYYEFFGSFPENLYKALNLPDSEHGSRLRVLRDATIDLSGISLKAGLKIGI
ncbi:MAG: hypothetical protein ACETWK_08490 [Candidatus Aminicenantaceae bacterium]